MRKAHDHCTSEMAPYLPLLDDEDAILDVNAKSDLDTLKDLLFIKATSAEQMSGLIGSHIQVPMGIGCKAANLIHKVRAVLFAAWLERGDDDGQMRDFLSSVCSLTTDLGTESYLLGCEARSWQELMPAWMGLGAGQVQPDSGPFEVEQLPEERGPDYIFDQGIAVPGMLHIVHNLTLAVDGCLSWWKPFLTKPDRRRRFVATCLTPFPEKAMWAPLFSADWPSIVDWRWSVVYKAIPHNLTMENLGTTSEEQHCSACH